MNLSKREFVALEILKEMIGDNTDDAMKKTHLNTDNTIKKAYLLADRFIEMSAESDDYPSDEGSCEVVSRGHIKDQVNVGQVWLDIKDGKSITVHTVDIIIRGASSNGYRESAHFPINMHRWAIMKDGESTDDAMARVARERKSAARQLEMELYVHEVFNDKLANKFTLNKINTLGDVLKLSPSEVEILHGIGAVAMSDITAVLASKGLYLGMLSDSNN